MARRSAPFYSYILWEHEHLCTRRNISWITIFRLILNQTELHLDQQENGEYNMIPVDVIRFRKIFSWCGKFYGSQFFSLRASLGPKLTVMTIKNSFINENILVTSERSETSFFLNVYGKNFWQFDPVQIGSAQLSDFCEAYISVTMGVIILKQSNKKCALF